MPDPVDPLGCPRPAGRLASPDGCDRAIPVVICDALPVPPLTLTGADCVGAPVTVVGAKGAVVQTVPHPDAVQKVQLCAPTANLKIEFSEQVMYSASTEQTLVRIREYNEDAGTWALRYETLAGVVYTGALPVDLNAVTAQVSVTTSHSLGCANGVAYSMRETRRFDAETGALESEIVDWVNSAGVVLPSAPAGFALGACPIVTPDRKVLIYLERNGGTVTMADIVAAVGTEKVQSVTVKQISGVGSVRADAGGGVPLDAGETWSWSAITGVDAWDFLGASALSLDAGSGEQRITATYIP